MEGQNLEWKKKHVEQEKQSFRKNVAQEYLLNMKKF